MIEQNIVPALLRGKWNQFVEATHIHALRIWGWEVVKEIHKFHATDRALVDLCLLKCAARALVLSEQGMTLAMLASLDVRNVFRRRLVDGGLFLEAMRLAGMAGEPLTRDEVVALGHRHVGSFDTEEVERFLVAALRTEGMSELDLRRLSKQFDVEMEHITL